LKLLPVVLPSFFCEREKGEKGTYFFAEANRGRCSPTFLEPRTLAVTAAIAMADRKKKENCIFPRGHILSTIIVVGDHDNHEGLGQKQLSMRWSSSF